MEIEGGSDAPINGLVENVAIVMVGFAVVALFVITFLAYLLLRLGIAYLLAAACSSVVFLDRSFGSHHS